MSSQTFKTIGLVLQADDQRFSNEKHTPACLFTHFTIIICLIIFSGLLFFHTAAQAERITYDNDEVNGHPGYLTAWEVNGPLDKVFMLVAGFDIENDDHPNEKLDGTYRKLIELLKPEGWDIIYFDYANGAIDLKENADNLARFIEYLDTQAVPDYHLAVIGGSMGGIVARTLFVQEYSAMGIDTYVSIDSPHWGVKLSLWLKDIAGAFFDYTAGRQMNSDDRLYDEHYNWLRATENNSHFMETVIDPVNTGAIALSNGEDEWEVDWDDAALHNKFYPIASYISSRGMRSTYMAYHSAVYMDEKETEGSIGLGHTRYRYKNTNSRYFDTKIPNPRKKHGAPEEVIKQAVDFVVNHQRTQEGE